nr:unnamed protein product [Callosobruchus analis]
MHPMRISICVILAVGYSCAAPGADPVARASPAPIAKADPTPEAKAEAAAKAKAEARPEAIPVPVPVPSYWPSPLSAFGLYKPIFSAYSLEAWSAPNMDTIQEGTDLVMGMLIPGGDNMV